jgi:Leucine-rich repeat (LRR) protein
MSPNIPSDNRALTRLDISKNALFNGDGTPAGKAISDMLAANSTLKELDVSSSAQYRTASKGGPSFAQAISVGIRDNGALTSLDISDNNLTNYDSDMSGKPRGHVFGLLI